jgi:hypothetical protein
MACTVKDSDVLRFAVGDRVQCRAKGGWLPGAVIKVLGPPLFLICMRM